MPVIQTTDLAKSFGKINAVAGISLSVEKGELFCLVGPDGAGKSTIIRMLCGIIAPTSGSATVLGNDTQKSKTELVKKIGYLSQRFSLYGDLSVDENIEFFARIHRVGQFAPPKVALEDLIKSHTTGPKSEAHASQKSRELPANSRLSRIPVRHLGGGLAPLPRCATK